MIQTWWEQVVTWWATVPPSFAFLLALPFAVAAAGLLGDAVRRRCHRH